MKRSKDKGERLSLCTILINVLLSLVKAVAGIIGHSTALISDAVHSLSDVVSTVIVILGLRLSRAEEDKEHEYGHERFECLAAILLSMMLALTGGLVGCKGIRNIVDGTYRSALLPSVLALYAALFSIFIKEGMFWANRKVALELNSPSLMADAHHHRSDALSSVGALVGVFLSRRGFLLGEPIANLVICLFILKAAVEVFLDASDKLTDKSCPKEMEEAMRRTIGEDREVLGLDSLKTRQFGAKVYVDVEIQVEGEKSLWEAHAVAERVHDRIEESYPEVKHCMVHVNPTERKGIATTINS